VSTQGRLDTSGAAVSVQVLCCLYPPSSVVYTARTLWQSLWPGEGFARVGRGGAEGLEGDQELADEKKACKHVMWGGVYPSGLVAGLQYVVVLLGMP
jgi:hypothetical protein